MLSKVATYFALIVLAALSMLSNIHCRCRTDVVVGCELECTTIVGYIPARPAEVQANEVHQVALVPQALSNFVKVQQRETSSKPRIVVGNLHYTPQQPSSSSLSSSQRHNSSTAKVNQKVFAATPETTQALSLKNHTVQRIIPSTLLDTTRTAFRKKTTAAQQQQQQRPDASTTIPQPLLPMQVLDEYIAQHNIDAVRQQPDGRQYMVAEFGCPRQAGVQSFNFMNAFLLAVASNRTLLFKYGGLKTWLANGENAESNCRQAFAFADWMPRLDQVFPRNRQRSQLMHKLPGVPPAKFVGNATILTYTKSWEMSRFHGEWHGMMNLQDHQASNHFSECLGISEIRRDPRIRMLYAEGPLFLYGMLFRRGFDFNPALLQSVQADIPHEAHHPHVFSIGLHSRHSNNGLDGSDISKELQCLHQVLAANRRRQHANNNNNNQTRCILYIMSDRSVTVDRFRNDTSHGCTVATVRRDEAAQKAEHTGPSEHGPFAGLGYFQDVVLTMQANSAFLGQPRSSTAFVVAMIEYRRKLSAWENGDERTIEPLVRCEVQLDHHG